MYRSAHIFELQFDLCNTICFILCEWTILYKCNTIALLQWISLRCPYCSGCYQNHILPWRYTYAHRLTSKILPATFLEFLDVWISHNSMGISKRRMGNYLGGTIKQRLLDTNKKYNPIRPVFMIMQIVGRCWVSYSFTATPAICRILFYE